MSVATGPNIVTNGLVFDYDMNNTNRSWMGAPTTNLVDPNWSSWTIDGSGQGSIGTRTITSSFGCTIVDSASNTRQNIYISSGISASTTYTFSVQYQKLSGTPTLRFQIQAYNSGTYLSTMSFATTAELGITNTDGWQTAKITVTTPANTNRILWFMQDGDDYTAYTHSFMLANVQCEQQSFATPFVWGTRSNTQALVDLSTTRYTITANSLTYASDNTFSFNGTSDYCQIPYTQSNPNNYTVEAWIYNTANSSDTNIGRQIVMAYNGYNGWIFSLNGLSSYLQLRAHNYNLSSTAYNLSYGTGLSLNTWYYVAGTDNGTTVNLYVNGVSVASTASVTATTNGVITTTIGAWPGASTAVYFTGKIPITRIYSRGLTASEISQNFNATRGRYGI